MPTLYICRYFAPDKLTANENKEYYDCPHTPDDRNNMAEDFPKDSLKVVDIEEVVVIATPKENRKLRELPAATTVLSQKDMQANQVNSVKRLSGLIPNIFIPEYGSKLTTSIYIRGLVHVSTHRLSDSM